jgi:NitT/TauT family transport system ATP-binding protein
MPLLQLTDVHFAFEGHASILSGFDLAIERGEFVTLLGPSGCGKSTILNLAAGLLVPTSGSVMFDGARLQGLNRAVGYMTQGDTNLPWLTVAQNVVLPLELRRTPRAERQEKLARALQLVNLTDWAHYYPSALSGGMKRRALLARSLIYSPPMLLMDEPFAALDAQLRETMHSELRATVNRLQESVLFVTHDIAESILLSDRVVVLDGRPLRILESVPIPFGKDRDMDSVRASPEYVAIEKALRRTLRVAAEDRAGQAGAGAVQEHEPLTI